MDDTMAGNELAKVTSAAVDGDWKTAAGALTAIGLAAIGGLSYYAYSRWSDTPMCMKNGCKRHGSLVKNVSLILCFEHEAALEREPDVRKLVQSKYRAEVRTMAWSHAGNAERADNEAVLACALDNQLLEAALAWVKLPDVTPGDAIDAMAAT